MILAGESVPPDSTRDVQAQKYMLNQEAPEKKLDRRAQFLGWTPLTHHPPP